MEKKMETTIVNLGYMGMMENKMEITIWFRSPLLEAPSSRDGTVGF